MHFTFKSTRTRKGEHRYSLKITRKISSLTCRHLRIIKTLLKITPKPPVLASL